MSEPRKAWVTTYAFTKGIERLPVVSDDGNYVFVKRVGCPSYGDLTRKGDAHETIDVAQIRVKQMVAAKLKSLDKPRAALEKLARDGAKVVAGE